MSHQITNHNLLSNSYIIKCSMNYKQKVNKYSIGKKEQHESIIFFYTNTQITKMCFFLANTIKINLASAIFKIIIFLLSKMCFHSLLVRSFNILKRRNCFDTGRLCLVCFNVTMIKA